MAQLMKIQGEEVIGRSPASHDDALGTRSAWEGRSRECRAASWQARHHRGNVGLLFGVDGWCGIEVLGAAHSTIFLVEMQIRTTMQYAHTQYVHIRDST